MHRGLEDAEIGKHRLMAIGDVAWEPGSGPSWCPSRHRRHTVAACGSVVAPANVGTTVEAAYSLKRSGKHVCVVVDTTCAVVSVAASDAARG